MRRIRRRRRLHFDVLKTRLAAEHALSVDFDAGEFQLVQWIFSADERVGTSRGAGRQVLVAKSFRRAGATIVRP
jgi:hypothetical protein